MTEARDVAVVVAECQVCGYPNLRVGAHADWCVGVTATLVAADDRLHALTSEQASRMSASHWRKVAEQ